MTVIPGTEISTSHNGKGLHLLGYHIDHTSVPLKKELSKQRTARRGRILNMAQKLGAIGWAVDTGAIEGKAGSVGRPLLAQIVFEDDRNRILMVLRFFTEPILVKTQRSSLPSHRSMNSYRRRAQTFTSLDDPDSLTSVVGMTMV